MDPSATTDVVQDRTDRRSVFAIQVSDRTSVGIVTLLIATLVVSSVVAVLAWGDTPNAATAIAIVSGFGGICAWSVPRLRLRSSLRSETAPALEAPLVEDARTRADLLAEIERMRLAQLELQANEVHFRALVETSGDIVWAVDASGCCTYVNGAALEAILGYRAEEIIGMPLSQFADTPSGQAFDDEFFRLSEHGGRFGTESVFLHRNGHPVHLAINAIALQDDEDRFVGASGTAVDVSEIKAAETLLRQALAEQHAILNSATVGIAIVENDRIVRANNELENMFGYPRGRAEGLPTHALCLPESRSDWRSIVESAVTGGTVYDRDVTCIRIDGTRLWCRLAVRKFERGGTHDATIWVFQDISDRKEKEQAIEHAALHDALTGLPNRALLSDRLDQAIRHSSRANSRFGILFLDLDRFKMVNDTIGHEGGDELLRTVASRLRNRVRATDTVARQGGDEFIVMLPEVRAMEDVECVAENLLAAVAEPITIRDNDYVVTGSIGISIYPDHGADAASLLKNADAAMYRAKELGKNTFGVFSEELHIQAIEDVRLENLLRVALDSSHLTVYYQPRVDLASGAIVSIEALARWHHETLGWIEPSRFVAVAERAGLINRLGDWVLRRSCRDLAHLSALGFRDLGLSVNVSHSQFSGANLAADIGSALADFGIAPQRVELELTETAIARDVDQAVDIMKRLDAAGIGVAIDDFGTGYSSLSQLKRFPIRTLKIDRSFVDRLPSDEDDVAIALAVIAMAKRLKMRVVAEGVETAEQRDFLLRHECDQAQGFLFSRPVPLADLVGVLRAESNRSSAHVSPAPRHITRRVA